MFGNALGKVVTMIALAWISGAPSQVLAVSPGAVVGPADSVAAASPTTIDEGHSDPSDPFVIDGLEPQSQHTLANFSTGSGYGPMEAELPTQNVGGGGEFEVLVAASEVSLSDPHGKPPLAERLLVLFFAAVIGALIVMRRSN